MKYLIYLIGLLSVAFNLQAELEVKVPEGFNEIEKKTRWVADDSLDSEQEIELIELRLDYSMNSVAMKRFTAIEEANLWIDYETTSPLIKNNSNLDFYYTKIEGTGKEGHAMITEFLVGSKQQFLTVRIRTDSGNMEKHKSIELDIEKQIVDSQNGSKVK